MTDPSPAQALYDRLSAIVPAEPRLAASLLMLRDSPDGMEVLMVVRNKAIEFASGAMVFPGGKLMESDKPAGMLDRLLDKSDLDDTEQGLRVAAVREAFEEVGMLPAATFNGIPATDAHILAIDPFRQAIDAGKADFAAALQKAGLCLDLKLLVRFAHIIAPSITPKRFNTHFYSVLAPAEQTPRPDGSEIVETLWIRPDQALDLSARGERQIMFPTRIVLMRLMQFATAADALAGAVNEPPEPLEPKLELRAGEVGLRTAAIPGFPATWETLDRLSGKRKTPIPPALASGRPATPD
jgi:8-oxo-dGTP pyrophosphatase MutT (NUDIX family)